jgi:hypothetical protein
LLEMLIAEVEKTSVLCSSLENSLPSPFIDTRGGSRFTTKILGDDLEKKAGWALWALLWRCALEHADHPWDVVVMLMMGRGDILGAIEDVRLPVVDVRTPFLC